MVDGKENDGKENDGKENGEPHHHHHHKSKKNHLQSPTKDDVVKEKKKKPKHSNVKRLSIESTVPVPCTFIEFGCEQKGTVDLNSHLSGQPVRHLAILNDGVLALKSDCRRLYTESEDLQRRLQRALLIEDRMIKAYGSHLLWKIDNWSDHVYAAKENHKNVIFSPAFYTARHGYKLVASIAPYGDGKARGNSMSVFVAVMKGDFDGLLDWPFGHAIRLSLLDQSEALGQRKNIDFNIIPNRIQENDPFLRRPDRDRNASFGAQHFVALPVLNTMEYIKNDTIFLRVLVDTEEMMRL